METIFNIGEECPKCKGSAKEISTQANESNGHEIPCGYCEGKGAIGIVEIKAETEGEARAEYEARFNVKLG